MGAQLRVGFAGTPDFAAVALQALLEAGFQVPLVLTQPDRPAGRGMKLQASAVKSLAFTHKIAVLQPMSLKLDGKHPTDAAQAKDALLGADLDVLVVAAYGLLLPTWTLDLPRWGCLNIHASLLPRWRGAAPIHRAIEAGDTETGVSIMQMDAGLDTGPVLASQAVPIAPHETTGSLHATLATLGGQLMVNTLRALQQGGPLPAQTQSETGVCYAHKIDKNEAQIDWQTPAQGLAQRLRAFDPFPGLVTRWRGETLKVWAGHALASEDGQEGASPGTVLESGPAGIQVQTGQGRLCLTELQRAGGKRLGVQTFLQGHGLHKGEVLG